MAIELIIFDLDGVLCSTPDAHYYSFKRAVESVTGIKITKKFHDLDLNGLSTKLKLKKLREIYNWNDEVCAQIWSLKQSLTSEYLDFLKPNLEKRKMLLALKEKGYKMACASNCIRDSVNYILKRINLLDLFDFTLSNEDVREAKPSAEIYLRAMIEFNCNPSNTMIIEDSKLGYEAASLTHAHVMRVVGPQDVNLYNIERYINKCQSKKMNQPYENYELNVVVPCAGMGSRFAEKGYTFIKPLIDVAGKTMIERVVESLNIKANYIFIVQKSHAEKYNLESFFNLVAPGSKTLTVDGLTEGAACTILTARELVNNKKPLLLVNSDQYIKWDTFEFFKNAQDNNLDGLIATFNSLSPKWSFCKVDDNGLVTEVAEKKPISNIATVGIYYWKHGEYFVNYAEKMINKNIRVNNEFYTVPVYNEAILDNKKIGVHQVESMFGTGTPEDLEYFLNNHQDLLN